MAERRFTPVISSPDNPALKTARKLAQKRGRGREGRVLLEGIRLVGEALAARLAFEYVLWSHRLLEEPGGPQLLGRLEAAARAGAFRLIEAAPSALDAAADVEHPQGVLAVARQPAHGWDAVLAAEEPLVLVADRIADPGNLGTLIRAADAAGATGVVCTAGSTDPYAPKAVRAAMGSTFHLPVLLAGELGEVLGRLRAAGLAVYAADPGGAVTAEAADWTVPVALVLGNEAQGVSPAAVQAADLLVRIPMPGRAESLNVALAGGILLYEAVRQRARRRAGRRGQGGLDPARQRRTHLRGAPRAGRRGGRS